MIVSPFLYRELRKLILFFGFAAPLVLSGQRPPEFLKYKIGNSGCEIFLPGPPGKISEYRDADSAKYWEAEVNYGGFVFGFFLKDSRPGIDNMAYDMDEAEYLKFQSAYVRPLIEKLSGKTQGNFPGPLVWDKPNAKVQVVLTAPVEIKTQAGKLVRARAWVDGEKRAILYVIGENSLPSKGMLETFLFGFRFP